MSKLKHVLSTSLSLQRLRHTSGRALCVRQRKVEVSIDLAGNITGVPLYGRVYSGPDWSREVLAER
jgi:hypothetical protein